MSFSQPQPDYGLLKNLPQPDPVGSALGAYQTVSSNIRANKATDLAQRLGALQAQKSQIEIHNLPIDERLKQQALRRTDEFNRMKTVNAKRTIHDARLADVHTAAAGHKEEAYQQYRHDMVSIGGDLKNLPLHYNDNVAVQAQDAYGRTATGGAFRKQSFDMAKQHLVNQGNMDVAAMKLRATPSAGTQQLGKSEAIANSKYKDSIIGDANAARNIITDTDNITASLMQAGAGYTGSMTNWTGAAGQELKKNTSQLVLDKLQGMHNVSRGTNLLMTIIKRSKPSDWMKRDAIQRIVSGMAAISHRAVEKQRFTQYMWDHGMIDRGKIDEIWGKYDEKYGLINVKNNTVNTQNIGRWAEYLSDKQRKKAAK